MIRCVFRTGDDELFKGFSFDGHAELAPHGEDTLCAAVSMLGQTTIAAIQEILAVPVSYEIEDESGRIRLTPIDDRNLDQRTREDLSLLIEQCLLGVKMAERAYPEHISWDIQPAKEDNNV